MAQYETKCLDIYNLIRKMPEHINEKSSLGYFDNLRKYDIKYLDADGRQATLSHVHFCDDRTEFLPDGKLYWKELAKGEYEKVVDSLLKALTEAK